MKKMAIALCVLWGLAVAAYTLTIPPGFENLTLTGIMLVLIFEMVRK